MPHYTVSDGTRLAYERHGRGPLVVLIHAGFVDSRAWSALAPLLAGEYTVVAPDRRGHGSSDGYRSDHSLDNDVDDLRQLVESLTGPDETALLVAHSAGCYVALGAALRSSLISGLILYEPPVFDRPPITADVWDRLDKASKAEDRAQLVAILLNDVVGRSTGQLLAPPALAAVLASPFGQILRDNALSLTTELHSYVAHRWDDETLRRVSAPIRLLVGERSPPFNRIFADHLSALAPDATVQVLAGQDHGAPLNAPNVMLAAIRSFAESARG